MIKKGKILDFVSKYDYIISLILLAIFCYFCNEGVVFIYDTETSIIDNVISLFGTLFGFILTCLSIFIVFKMDDEYLNGKGNEYLKSLLNNSNFSELYNLFIKNLYALGIVLILSFFMYFIDSNNIIFSYFMGMIYFLFLFLAIFRTILSIVAFKIMIKVITKK